MSADSLEDDFIPEPTFSIKSKKRSTADDEDEFTAELVDADDHEGPSADSQVDEESRTNADSSSKSLELSKPKKKKQKKEKNSKADGGNAAKATSGNAAGKGAEKRWRGGKHSLFAECEVKEQAHAAIPADRTLDSIVPFVTSLKDELSSSGKEVFIVCPSAERAISIIPKLKSVAKIGKLFARHIKVNEQVEVLKKFQFPISVGTPNRIFKLIEAGALNCAKIGYIILDGTYEDKKSRTIFDIPELRADLNSLLKATKDSGAPIIVF
ncbi:cms1 ribosomal small subunit [Chytridiales sp. JEL 0842]|nr:cms1 ribosomal small subunit [Chytridiales sp. JEL 0842]